MEAQPHTESTRTHDFLAGPRLEHRDRELFALLGIARLLSTEQVARLLWPGRHSRAAPKRLEVLAGLAPGRWNRQVGPRLSDPFLFRLRFRTFEFRTRQVWGLTRPGLRAAALQLHADLREFRRDLAEQFLEHHMALTDLFVELAAPYVSMGVLARELPFAWAPTETELPWFQYDAQAQKTRARRIVPDAILEVPRLQRRYFVECETGSHSVVAESDEKGGATVAKVARYDAFFGGYADASTRLTFYAQRYPDSWPCEVLFLVPTERRRDYVNRAVTEWAEGRQAAVKARAVTLEGLVKELQGLLPPPPQAPIRKDGRRLSAAAPPPEGPGVLVSREDYEALARFYNDSTTRFRALQAQLAARGPASGVQGPLDLPHTKEAFSVLERLRASLAGGGEGARE